ncbi:MAG: hydroxypyruvate isomerase [Hyphomicrobiales bacterium]|nr:MAG: hydroxypyruvate isomerase [Hyphomicrobiales bacterium]
MTLYSACIEWLFANQPALPPLPGTPESNIVRPAPVGMPDRIRAAKAAGLDAVEFWQWSSKDLDAVKGALDETGLPLAGILCEPIAQITDPEAHPMFLEGVRASLLAALKLGAPVIIAQAGDHRPGVPREAQHAAIVKVLREAAGILAGSGVVLALEPLNDRVDHPGYYLTSTIEGLDIVDEVDRPEIRLLYDMYHSAMMGEHIEDVLEGRVDRIVHVHLADTQGRAEPGTGTLDWRIRLDWLAAHGYDGFVGLEYRPTGSTEESLAFR